MARDEQTALIGRTIAGKFAIDSIIGAGAMGTVYRAKQVALDKYVAIKVMHRSPRTSSGGTPPTSSDPNEPMTDDAMFAHRFLREAKAASRIDHPSSLRVIDFGEEPDGILYMAMEFLDGRDLFTVIREDYPLSTPRIVGLMLQALAAIAVAHEMGVIHRDLKPENIMVMSGTDDEGHPKDVVKVCDFGIAKITARHTDLGQSQQGGPKLTTAGLVVGTPEYMSPEQGRGEPLDARSDLYSIGVILFQLMTGKLPFEAETALGVVLKHVTDAPPRPTSIEITADPRLEAICLKAMQKKPDDRYQTARAMRAELRALDEASTGLISLPGARSQPQRLSLPTAATEVALDSGAVRAAMASAPRTQSKVTPLGTELEEDYSVVPRRRWTGLVLAALLLGATATVVVAKLTQKKTTADVDPTPSLPSITAVNDVDAAPLTNTVDTASLAPLESANPHKHTKTPPRAPDAGTADVAGTGSSPSATASAPVPVSTGSYDPATAHVVLAGITPRNTNNRDVRTVLNLKQYSECYREGLKGLPRPAITRSTMKLDTDDSGRINSATLNGKPIPPAAGNCILNGMIGKTIGGSGAVGADVDLVFLPDEK